MRPLLAVACVPWLATTLCAQLAFTNVVDETDTEFVSFGRGAAMVDFDGDGRLDVFAGAAEDPSRVWRQLPDATFEDVTAAWGMPDDGAKTWSVVVADFDEDADPDVFLGNGGFYGPPQANQMLRNDVGALGQLTDVSAAAGVTGDIGQTFGSTTLDYDRDGDLDLFWADIGGPGTTLVRNDGGLVFTDVTIQAGVEAFGRFRHAGAGDYDNDGWPDIGVGGALNTPTMLFHNEQDGTFTEQAAAAGIDLPGDKFGLVFEDFDNDGWLDVFVPIYQPDVVTQVSRLFVNDGDGTFTDVSAQTIITGQTDMGHNVGDLDADGYPDLYIGTGHPMFADLDLLYRMTPDGNGGVVLEDVSASSGVTVGGTPTRCHGMAMGDYDEDGDVDVYVNNGGPAINAKTSQGNFFFRNEGNANGWTKLDPRGVLSPRTPAGLRAAATTSAGRQVWRRLAPGKGFGNSDSPILHFGLGGDAGLERIDLLWPSGIEQTLLDPPLEETTLVVETGMRLDGEPALGASVALEVAGPDGHAVSLWTAAGTIEAPLPKFGGILYVAPPLVTLADAQTDASGRLTLPLTIPDVPVLSGVTAPLQAWIRPEGAGEGGTLSNLVELAIP